MNLAVLPLAVTMMAGPQILSAFLFVTSESAVVVSSAFLAGVVIAVTAGVAVTSWLAGAIGLGGQPGGAAGPAATVVQIGLVVLLIVLALKNWVGRASAEPPPWLGALLSAGPGKAFTTGLLLAGLFPSDLLVMLTVGVNLAATGAPFTAALPFIGVTVLIAASPLLCYLFFRRRAEVLMPKVRDWMTVRSWLVNIFVCLFFVLLILF
jgi:Sap-like sulfolipid-1-addressing protein